MDPPQTETRERDTKRRDRGRENCGGKGISVREAPGRDAEDGEREGGNLPRLVYLNNVGTREEGREDAARVREAAPWVGVGGSPGNG